MEPKSRFSNGARTTLYLFGMVLGLAAALQPRMLSADMIGHGGIVRTVAISSDGEWVATGSFDYTARLWDFDVQQEAAVLQDHAGPVNGVAFSPDGKHLATTSDDGTARIWAFDAAGATLKATLEGHSHKVMDVAYAPDGSRLATASWDRTVRLWEAATGKLLRSFEHPSPVNVVRFTADGQGLATGAHDGKIRLFRAKDGIQTGMLEGHALGISRLEPLADGKRLLSASLDKTLKLWDLGAQTEIVTLEGHEGPVFAAALTPDQSGAVSAGREGVLLVWSFDQPEQHRTLPAHDGMVWDLDVSPDGRFAITVSTDSSVRVIHLETGDRIGRRQVADSGPEPWESVDHPGRGLYRKCANCHTLSPDAPGRSGPHFQGLFGRRAGSVPGYNYSATLQRADFVWDAETLSALFTEGPHKFVPGSKMPLQKVTDRTQLADLIEFLKVITAPGG